MRLPVHVTYRRRRRHIGAALRRLVVVLLLTALLYLLLTTFLLGSVREGSVSMSPAIEPGDRLLVSPLTYGAHVPLTRLRMPALRTPERGEIAVVEARYLSPRSRGLALAEAFVGFVTGHYVTQVGRDRSPPRFLIKRIIGMPGDTVRMEGYRAQIRPAGAAEFVDEAALVPFSYTPTPGPASAYEGDLPFGGSLDPLELGAGEYFVLGDNRAQSSDSRSWGPVPAERVLARVLLRYAPLRRFGRP